MSTVKLRPTLTNSTSWEELRRWTAIAIQSVVQTVNGQLEFGFNLRSSKIEAVFPTTGEVRFFHKLGKLPTGFLVKNLDAGEVIYSGATTWTEESIYLQATGPCTATIEVI